MAEETFRPERRPIQNSEKSAAEVNISLEKMASMRKEAEVDNFDDSFTPAPVIAMKGNMPPAMRALMQERKGASNHGPQQKNHPVNSNSRAVDLLIDTIRNNKIDYEKITLPSLGKFYDGTTGPIDGVLHIRQMTGEEENILATPRMIKKGEAINKIFNRCMQEKYDSENFLVPDRLYLLIFLRGISYSHLYDCEVKCPLCDKKFATEINLDDLEMEYCPEDFGSDNLEDVLPKTGYKFKYALSNGKSEQAVQNYRDKRMKGFDMTGMADDTLLYRTATMITEIEGITEKSDLQKLLKVMPIDDLSYMRSKINEPPFGVDTKVEITCSSCAGDFEMELPLEANFFFPKQKKAAK